MLKLVYYILVYGARQLLMLEGDIYLYLYIYIYIKARLKFLALECLFTYYLNFFIAVTWFQIKMLVHLWLIYTAHLHLSTVCDFKSVLSYSASLFFMSFIILSNFITVIFWSLL